MRLLRGYLLRAWDWLAPYTPVRLSRAAYAAEIKGWEDEVEELLSHAWEALRALEEAGEAGEVKARGHLYDIVHGRGYWTP